MPRKTLRCLSYLSLLIMASHAACRGRAQESKAAATAHTEPAASNAPTRPPKPPVSAAPSKGCTQLPFEEEYDLPEASGAVFVPGDTRHPARVLVVGDSGTRGRFVELDGTSGAVLARGSLPLDNGASDDLEGLSRVGKTFYAITSSGFVRHWQRTDAGFRLSQSAYPLTAHGEGEVPRLACKNPHRVNCGRNFEGLCLAPGARIKPAASAENTQGCAGYAVSKRDGALYCLRFATSGQLYVDPAGSIQVASGRVLSGCHYAETEIRGAHLLVAANLFARNAVYTIRATDKDHQPAIEVLDHVGPGFGEAIAVAPGGIVYRFSDTGGSPSHGQRFRCL